MSPAIARAGVVGGGRMGSGIAHALLLAGSSVVVIEADDARSEAARTEIVRLLAASAARGALTEYAARVKARLTLASDAVALAGCGLVIEAVPEVEDVKLEVLQRIGAAIDPSTVVATNTSSISIDYLSAAVPYRERFLGMHFFNPVPASSLVEVVRGAATSDEAAALAVEIVTAMSKTPIVVSDSPGFASSRLGVLLGLEAIRMVEAGVATPEDIDAAMTLGYRHPVGPLRLTDLVGLDVRLDIARYLEPRLGDRFAPPQLLIDMVARGELGRKSGRGFFAWDPQE